MNIKNTLKHIAEGGELTREVIEDCRRAHSFLNGDSINIPCVDCTEKDIEYYMVEDSTWREAGFKTKDGIICITCIETRIKRRLKREDFEDIPLNQLVRRMMVNY